MARSDRLQWNNSFLAFVEALHERDGLSWEAIGDRYGLSKKSMRTRYYQAKRALQPTLGHAGDGATQETGAYASAD